jgi:hypothetical protein
MHMWRRVESWSFACHTKWNIFKTKKEQKSVKEVTLQFSMIFQMRLKNNTVNFRVTCPSNASFPNCSINYVRIFWTDHTGVGFKARGRIVAFFAAVPENSRSKIVYDLRIEILIYKNNSTVSPIIRVAPKYRYSHLQNYPTISSTKCRCPNSGHLSCVCLATTKTCLILNELDNNMHYTW